MRHRSSRAPASLVNTQPDILARARRLAATSAPKSQLKPADMDVARNPLRPASLDEMVGQRKLRPLLRRLIDAARQDGRRLDHLLLVGASGTGKTTAATVIAREMDTRVFTLKAPVDMETLEALRQSAQDGDIVFVDEIHLWTQGDRRGRTQASDPESVFTLLEDGVLMTPRGQMPFPDVTWLGATTDVGLLPEPLVNRFPIQPRLEPYTEEDMTELARRNALALELVLEQGAAATFAGASRLNPRQLNSYMRSAKALGQGMVTQALAREVVEDLASTTLDGLDSSMQAMLRYLFSHGRRDTKDGPVYKASAGALATAAGHGRDVKIVYTKEAYLIERGLLTVQPGGRTLTEQGIQRAKELT